MANAHHNTSNNFARWAVAVALQVVTGALLITIGCSSDAPSGLGRTQQPYAWDYWGDWAKRGPTCDTCAADTAPGCGNKCVKIKLQGESCSTDPCAEDGRCEDDHYCDPSTHTCRSGFAPLGWCNAASTNICPWGYFCLDLEADCGRLSSTPGVTHSLCVDGQVEGQECDSDLANPKCYPCEPGLSCINGKCQVKCEDDSSCPCYRQGSKCIDVRADPDTAGYGADDSHCFECKSLGNPCSAREPCCNDNSVCKGTAIDGSGPKKCCLPVGESCTGSDQCCRNEFCGGGSCVLCKSLGEACADTSQCCGGTGLECADGVCRVPCEPGLDCKVTQSGACKGQWGKTSCSDKWTSVCEPNADDPCLKDDGGDGCKPEEKPDCKDQRPLGCDEKFKADGTAVCHSGTWECSFTVGIDFCPPGSCDTPGCGACAARPCGPSTLCAPGSVCSGPPGSVACNACVGDLITCWKPSDVGTGCMGAI